MNRRAPLLLLALGLMAGACSGAGDSSDGIATLETESTVVAADETSTEADEEVDAEQAMLDLAACLREQGVDIEDPTVDAEGNVEFGEFLRAAGEDVDRGAIRGAMGECRDELQGVALGFGGAGFDLTELEDTLLEYAACMRQNGYDMDDPDFSGFGSGQGGEPGAGGGGRVLGPIETDDPDFIAAQEVCGDILSGMPGPGAGRGRGNG